MDIRALMKQAQKMQQQMAETQELLAAKSVTAEVAGGQVSATMNGKHQLTALTIKPEAIDPDDTEAIDEHTPVLASPAGETVRNTRSASRIGTPRITPRCSSTTSESRTPGASRSAAAARRRRRRRSRVG